MLVVRAIAYLAFAIRLDAFCTASTIAEYVPQRQRCGEEPLMYAVLICSTDGDGVCSSSAVAVIIMPFWQKPHMGTCSSIQACCTGCKVWLDADPDRPFCFAHRSGRPSRVVICLPATVLSGSTHERASLPSTSTEQAPHCDRPQPNCGPLNSRSLRRTYNSGVSPGAWTSRRVPLTMN